MFVGEYLPLCPAETKWGCILYGHGYYINCFFNPYPRVGVVQSNNMGCISKFPALSTNVLLLQPHPRVTVAPTGTQYRFTKKFSEKSEFSERVTADTVAQLTVALQISC